jgi:hypothetical protein
MRRGPKVLNLARAFCDRNEVRYEEWSSSGVQIIGLLSEFLNMQIEDTREGLIFESSFMDYRNG